MRFVHCLYALICMLWFNLIAVLPEGCGPCWPSTILAFCWSCLCDYARKFYVHRNWFSLQKLDHWNGAIYVWQIRLVCYVSVDFYAILMPPFGDLFCFYACIHEFVCIIIFFTAIAFCSCLVFIHCWNKFLYIVVKLIYMHCYFLCSNLWSCTKFYAIFSETDFYF